MISHRELFNKLRDDSVVARCVQYAHWTLPQLMANYADHRGNSRVSVERDWQAIGALLVNNLSSKLARLLFPVSTPFFKIEASEKLKSAAADAGKGTELDSQLANLELKASQRLFLNGSYAQLILALKHLVCTGNVLMYRDASDAESRTYGLQSFGIRRDGKGHMLDCVLRESTYVEALAWDVQKALRDKEKAKYSRPEAEVELYTRIHRKVMESGVVYEVTQQVDTIPIGEPSTYPQHLCPWHAPTWSLILGEHYGRGHVEDFAGDFARISDMSEAGALYSIELMRVLHLVSSGSGTDIDDIANAETGEYVRGDPDTVKAYESGDAQKLRAVDERIDAVMSRLSRAFMYTGNTRDAERVTAYELQKLAEEAEYTLGGNYSSLSAGIQVPLAAVLLTEENPSALEGLVTGDLKLNIKAGIPALGRSSEVQNLALAVQESAAIVQPLIQIDQRFDPAKLVDLIMAGRSVDVKALHLSEKQQLELKKAMQQQQQGQQQITDAQGTAAAADQLQQMTATGA